MVNYSCLNLRSKAEYKDVKNVVFTPMVEIKLKKAFNKGERRTWKLLGFIPIFRYKVKNDLYKYYLWNGTKTLDSALELLNEFCEDFIRKENKIYRKAIVIIQYVSSSTQTHRFSSNEEAMNFVNDLKKACKSAGNELQ